MAQPEVATFSAEQLERLDNEIRERTCGRIKGLQVSIQDNLLIITGKTKTYHAKQLATTAALDAVEGFPLGVGNEVEVG